MKPFRKRPQAETISEFWQWWATVRDDVAQAVSAGDAGELGEEIGRRVRAIDPGLEWQVRRDSTSTHALAVTPRWPEQVRAVAERWLAAAPPADRTWSYRSVRVVADLSGLESTRQLDGHVVDLADCRFGLTVKEQLRQIDVVCHHPSFAGRPTDFQEYMAHHAVEWAVGEDDAVIWIDEVDWSVTEPAGSRSAAELRDAVGTLIGGLDHWQQWSGEWDGLPARFEVASPLRPERWPRFDLYVAIELPFQRYDGGKMPVGESHEALLRFRGELTAAVGADGALVAHDTFRCSQTLHFYVDSQSGARAGIESRLPQWREGDATAFVELDPAYDRSRRFMDLGE